MSYRSAVNAVASRGQRGVAWIGTKAPATSVNVVGYRVVYAGCEHDGNHTLKAPWAETVTKRICTAMHA